MEDPLEDPHHPLVFQLFSTPNHIIASTGEDYESVATSFLHAQLVGQLQQHGYAILSLQSNLIQLVEKSRCCAQEVFASPLDIKRSKYETSLKNFGYQQNKRFQKESFHIRCFREDTRQLLNILWQGHNNDSEVTKELFEYTYTTLFRVCQQFVSTILTALGYPTDALHDLFEPAHNDDAFEDHLSTSSFSLLHYFLAEGEYREEIQSPPHCDVSLLTFIPLFGQSGGLHVYDQKEKKWIDICSNVPRDQCAIIFGGETLARLTANLIPAALHQVVNIGPGPRLSTPFHFCAARKAVLDGSRLFAVQALVQKGSLSPHSPLLQPVQAGVFMDEVCRTRVDTMVLKPAV